MSGMTEAVEWVRDVGVLGILVAIIIGWLRGWVVSRREFDAITKDRDWWRDTAMRALSIGEAAVGRRPDDDSGAGRR